MLINQKIKKSSHQNMNKNKIGKNKYSWKWKIKRIKINQADIAINQVEIKYVKVNKLKLKFVHQQ